MNLLILRLLLMCSMAALRTHSWKPPFPPAPITLDYSSKPKPPSLFGDNSVKRQIQSFLTPGRRSRSPQSPRDRTMRDMMASLTANHNRVPYMAPPSFSSHRPMPRPVGRGSSGGPGFNQAFQQAFAIQRDPALQGLAVDTRPHRTALHRPALMKPNQLHLAPPSMLQSPHQRHPVRYQPAAGQLYQEVKIPGHPPRYHSQAAVESSVGDIFRPSSSGSRTRSQHPHKKVEVVHHIPVLQPRLKPTPPAVVYISKPDAGMHEISKDMPVPQGNVRASTLGPNKPAYNLPFLAGGVRAATTNRNGLNPNTPVPVHGNRVQNVFPAVPRPRPLQQQMQPSHMVPPRGYPQIEKVKVVDIFKPGPYVTGSPMSTPGRVMSRPFVAPPKLDTKNLPRKKFNKDIQQLLKLAPTSSPTSKPKLTAQPQLPSPFLIPSVQRPNRPLKDISSSSVAKHVLFENPLQFKEQASTQVSPSDVPTLEIPRHFFNGKLTADSGPPKFIVYNETHILELQESEESSSVSDTKQPEHPESHPDVNQLHHGQPFKPPNIQEISAEDVGEKLHPDIIKLLPHGQPSKPSTISAPDVRDRMPFDQIPRPRPESEVLLSPDTTNELQKHFLNVDEPKLVRSTKAPQVFNISHRQPLVSEQDVDSEELAEILKNIGYDEHEMVYENVAKGKPVKLIIPPDIDSQSQKVVDSVHSYSLGYGHQVSSNHAVDSTHSQPASQYHPVPSQHVADSTHFRPASNDHADAAVESSHGGYGQLTLHEAHNLSDPKPSREVWDFSKGATLLSEAEVSDSSQKAAYEKSKFSNSQNSYQGQESIASLSVKDEFPLDEVNKHKHQNNNHKPAKHSSGTLHDIYNQQINKDGVSSSTHFVPYFPERIAMTTPEPLTTTTTKAPKVSLATMTVARPVEKLSMVKPEKPHMKITAYRPPDITVASTTEKFEDQRFPVLSKVPELPQYYSNYSRNYYPKQVPSTSSPRYAFTRTPTRVSFGNRQKFKSENGLIPRYIVPRKQVYDDEEIKATTSEPSVPEASKASPNAQPTRPSSKKPIDEEFVPKTTTQHSAYAYESSKEPAVSSNKYFEVNEPTTTDKPYEYVHTLSDDDIRAALETISTNQHRYGVYEPDTEGAFTTRSRQYFRGPQHSVVFEDTRSDEEQSSGSTPSVKSTMGASTEGVKTESEEQQSSAQTPDAVNSFLRETSDPPPYILSDPKEETTDPTTTETTTTADIIATITTSSPDVEPATQQNERRLKDAFQAKNKVINSLHLANTVFGRRNATNFRLSLSTTTRTPPFKHKFTYAPVGDATVAPEPVKVTPRRRLVFNFRTGTTHSEPRSKGSAVPRIIHIPSDRNRFGTKSRNGSLVIETTPDVDDDRFDLQDTPKKVFQHVVFSQPSVRGQDDSTTTESTTTKDLYGVLKPMTKQYEPPVTPVVQEDKVPENVVKVENSSAITPPVTGTGGGLKTPVTGTGGGLKTPVTGTGGGLKTPVTGTGGGLKTPVTETGGGLKAPVTKTGGGSKTPATTSESSEPSLRNKTTGNYNGSRYSVDSSDHDILTQASVRIENRRPKVEATTTTTAATTELDVVDQEQDIVDSLKSMKQKTQEMASKGLRHIMPLVMELSSDVSLSSDCTFSLLRWLRAMRTMEQWAVRMMDASSKIPEGILYGTFSTFGSYDECVAIKTPKANLQIPYTGQYCSVNIQPVLPPSERHFTIQNAFKRYPKLKKVFKEMNIDADTMAYYYILKHRIGLCMPSTCTLDDLGNVTEKVADHLKMKISVERCETAEKPSLTRGQVISMSAVFIAFGIVLLATLIDISMRVRPRREMDLDEIIRKKNGLRQFSYVFSAYGNACKILDTSLPTTHLSSLHGIKFLSITWVMLGHVYYCKEYLTLAGLTKVRDLGSNLAFQVILNSGFAADTFFFLSGLLVVYSTFIYLENHNGRFTIVGFYIRRYCRLTPAFLMISGVILLGPLAGSGPIWHETLEPFVSGCQNYWWTNLFYFSNFMPTEKTCVPHGWFLSCDMQFYVVAPIIILALYRQPKIGLLLIAFGILSSMITTGTITFLYDLSPVSLFSLPDPKDINEYLNTIGYKPYAHYASYCIGMATGFLLAAKQKINVSKCLQIFGWIATSVSCCLVIYGTWDWNSGELPDWPVAVAYATTSRTVWCLGVAWLTVICYAGHGGVVNTILSWQGFVPLSRLTYLAYLIHPLLMYLYASYVRSPFYFSQYVVVYLYLGHLCVTFGLAFIFSLAFELPFLNLERLVSQHLDKNKRKRRASFSSHHNHWQHPEHPELKDSVILMRRRADKFYT